MPRYFLTITATIAVLVFSFIYVENSKATKALAFAWMDFYPSSTSDDDIKKATGTVCQLCHAYSDGGSAFNPYGWQLKQFDALANPKEAFRLSETYNSDKDINKKSNKEEINGGSQPGWRYSSKNRVYLKSGSTKYSSPPDNVSAD